MKRYLLTASLAALFSVASLAQDYDLTKIYLHNAGFDSHFDYTIDDTGNVAQEILDVDGWTKDISVNYTITGVYQIGTKKTFNGASVPSTGQDGSTDGGVLALSTGWNQSMIFYQTVELPEGKYSLVSAFYNSDEKTAGLSRVAWLPNGKAAVNSTLEGFPTGQWVTDTVRFELTQTTKGRIQIGFQANANQGSANFAKPCLDFVKLLRDTNYNKADMDRYKQQLQSVIDQALKAYGDGSGNGADALKAAIDDAQAVMSDDAATPDQVDEAVDMLTTALDTYLWANPTGAVPTVVTDTRHARGATMAFGRMSYSGVTGSEVSEQGFCWSENPEPTINDHRTTRDLTNNGRIYWLDDLAPATCYYMRAYVITKGRQVGYGDVIRFYTIPKGQITFNIRTSNDSGADARIRAAAEKAVGFWNNLTEMKGFSTSIGYNSGVPTAECSYGGWMSVGSNQSYQKAGTIMHEMLHGIGVIPWADTEWSRFNLRSGTSNAAGFTTGSGNWLGDRVTEVLRFWDNSATEQLNGDYQHMWPYGINGASYLMLNNTICYFAVFFVMILFLVGGYRQAFKSFKKWYAYFIGIAAGIFLIIFSISYNLITNVLIESGTNANQSAANNMMKSYPLISLLLIGIVGPIVEEFTYRVGLFSFLRRINVWVAYLVTIVFFTFIHFNFDTSNLLQEFISLPNYIVAGLVFCILYDKIGLSASITAHITNNFTAAVFTILVTLLTK